jgi:hypothetical protein
MADQGFTDTDKGMEKALAELAKLGNMYAKVGFPDNDDSNSDGVRIAQYAYWNENGVTSNKNVLKKGKLWVLPPRPFMSQAVDNNEEQIVQTGEKLVKQVTEGKIDARTAMRRNAENMVSLIKMTIKNGDFKENADITINGTAPGKDGKQFIRGKKSSKPLIDSGIMRDSVMYQIFENEAKVEEGGKKTG